MKVLIVSPQLPSSAVPMRGLRSNEQFRIYRDLGHDVRAIVPVAWAPPVAAGRSRRLRRAIPRLEDDHGTEISHPRFFSLGRLSRPRVLHRLQREFYWRALRREVKDFVASGGDIVHAHSCGLPGVMATRVAPAKLVVSMHDDELFDVAPAHPAVRSSIRRALHEADAVVYVSRQLYELGIELAGPHAGHVIPIGIDEYPDVVPSLDDKFTIATASRLIPRKNIDLLIEAFGQFRVSAPDAHLIIVGDGPERQRLENVAQEIGAGERVEFTGSVPHRLVLEILARAHLFVLPSVREALGAVYFEAMAMRVPVVGVRGEGIAGHVTNGRDGFLVPPNDIESIATIIREMYEQPGRRREIGEQGFALFDRSGVRWQDYVLAHVELFKRLMSNKGARADR